MALAQYVRGSIKKLITISRQFGSGGRIIGKIVAEKLGVKFYDKEIIEMATEESGIDKSIFEGEELRAKNSFTYGLSSAICLGESISADPMSINDRVFVAQYKVIEKIAESGEGVIVGRCADFVLKDVPGVTNIFIHGEKQDRIRRCIEEYGEQPETIEELVKTYDKARENYYNYHTSFKWGDIKNYNLSLNSSYIDYEQAANLIIEYIEKRKY